MNERIENTAKNDRNITKQESSFLALNQFRQRETRDLNVQDLIEAGIEPAVIKDYLRTAARNQEEYNSVADSYRITTAIHAAKERESIDYAIEVLGERRGLVIDLGCAWGRDVKHWEENHFRYLGVDTSEGLIEIGRTQHHNATFIEADMVFKRFEPESAVMVWASSSLQHIPSTLLPIVLQNAYEALKPGGVFYANYRPPAEGKDKEGYVSSSEYRDSSGERKEIARFIAHYTGEEMIALLEAAGFEVLKEEDYNEDYDKYDDGGEKAAYLPKKNIIHARKPG